MSSIFNLGMKYLKISTITLICSLQLVCNLQIEILAQGDEISGDNNNCQVQTARAEFKFFTINNFEQFKKIFNKHYTSIAENLSRKSLYINRAVRAFKSAVKYKYNKSDYYLKVNQMSDWTDRELQGTLIPVEKSSELYDKITDYDPIEKKRYKRGILKDSKLALNKAIKGPGYNFVSIDHRDSRCLTSVKDQGTCGSCYIFATLALYEWLYCKATGKSIDFSEQYVIDCGHRSGASGCQGGVVKNVVDFISDYGLEIEQNYPNTDAQGVCKFESSQSKSSLGFIRPMIGGLHSIDEDDFEKFLKKSPILVTLQVNSEFFQYGGGVDDARGCDYSRLHAVLLVGQGRQDGKDYWLMRNSHGPFFGEDGHYKLNKLTHCFHWLGYRSEDKFKPNSHENMNPHYDIKVSDT